MLRVATCVLVALSAVTTVADELEKISADQAAPIAQALNEQAEKLTHAKVRVEADVEKPRGFHVPKRMGAMILPQKGLAETAEFAAKFATDPGASLGVLYLYHLTPVVDGKPLDASKFSSVKVSDGEGQEHVVQVAWLVVKQNGADDYRLHVYGSGEKPLVDVKFQQEAGPGETPLTIEAKDVNKEEHQGNLVVSVFDKYQTKFRVAYTGQ